MLLWYLSVTYLSALLTLSTTRPPTAILRPVQYHDKSARYDKNIIYSVKDEGKLHRLSVKGEAQPRKKT